MSDPRIGVAELVASVILARWCRADVRGWTVGPDGGPRPAPTHRWELTADTSPSGKAVFRCAECGACTSVPLGQCRGEPLYLASEPLRDAILRGVRYEPRSDGCPVPWAGHVEPALGDGFGDAGPGAP